MTTIDITRPVFYIGTMRQFVGSKVISLRPTSITDEDGREKLLINLECGQQLFCRAFSIGGIEELDQRFAEINEVSNA